MKFASRRCIFVTFIPSTGNIRITSYWANERLSSQVVKGGWVEAFRVLAVLTRGDEAIKVSARGAAAQRVGITRKAVR